MPKLSGDEVGKVIRQDAEQCQCGYSIGGQDPDIAVLLPRLARLTTCHVSRRAFKVPIVHEFPPDAASFCHEPASYIAGWRIDEKFYSRCRAGSAEIRAQDGAGRLTPQNRAWGFQFGNVFLTFLNCIFIIRLFFALVPLYNPAINHSAFIKKETHGRRTDQSD